MDIRLMSLGIENFKGVKKFSTEIDGANILIEGDNGAGKTTIYDAFMWLLFGEDSLGQANFNIKPMSGNQVIHGLMTMVEAMLRVDNVNLKLMRVFKEKWTKSRGEEEKQLTGHETEFYVNGLPVKKNEYEAKVRELIETTTFKLMTNVSYFPSLKWDIRRQLLFDFFGEVNDEELLTGELAELKDSLSQYGNVENYNKSLVATRKKLNQSLSEIPVRIDEASREIREIRGLDEITKEKSRIEKEITEMQKVTPNKRLEERQSLLRGLMNEMGSIEEVKRGEFNKARNKKENQLSALSEELRLLERAKSEIVREKLIAIENQSRVFNDTLKQSRYDWGAISKAKANENCPTCGQPWPSNKVEEFNLNRAKRLEEITANANNVKKEMEELELVRQKLVNDVKGLDIRITKGQFEKEALEKEIAGMVFNLEGDKEYAENLRAYEALKSDMQKQDTGTSKETQLELEKLSRELASIQEEIAVANQNKVLQERIKELSNNERNTAKTLQEVERQIYLCENYMKKKAGHTTDKINRNFETVSFQMFRTLINGGIEPCCEISYNGVFWDSLSYSEKIKAGLEIIRAFQKARDVYAPVFIDNRESVTTIPEMDCQLVNIYKIKGIKLRIRTDNN